MPMYGASKLEAELFGEKHDPMRDIYDEYLSKCKAPPEKVLAKAMKKAGYSTEHIIACLKRKRAMKALPSPECLKTVKASRRSSRKKMPKRVLHSKYMNMKTAAQALEEL